MRPGVYSQLGGSTPRVSAMLKSLWRKSLLKPMGWTQMSHVRVEID